jgi:hypothetical protein
MFLPGLLTYYGVLNLGPDIVRSLAITGLLGPILSGFIMTAATGRLLRRIARWRVGLQWYVFALVGLPAIMLLGTIIRPGALKSFDIFGSPSPPPTSMRLSLWFSSEDRSLRNQAGPASRSLVCSGFTALWPGLSSSVVSGPCGTCLDS